jgi:NADH pyrophosphatase NudC (nudix superfamily)
MDGYIKWLRSKVGTSPVIVNYVIACVTDESGNILLQKRSKDKDIWGWLGGIIEYGESAEEAVHREVMEESGLEVKIDYLIGIYTKYFQTFDDGSISQMICNFFKCSIVGGSLTIDNYETFDLKFFEPTKIPKFAIPMWQDNLTDFLSGKKGIYR